MILGDMYSCLDFQNCLSTIISDVYIPSAKKFIQDYIRVISKYFANSVLLIYFTPFWKFVLSDSEGPIADQFR